MKKPWCSWKTQVINAVERAFERNQMPEPYSGCSLWIGEWSEGGYGVFKAFGTTIRAHRIAWEIRNGEIPNGLSVLHKCDTACCVNPDHLYLGTQLENMRDAFTRNRFPDKRMATDELVNQIRNATGSFRSIGRTFGINDNTVRAIKKNFGRFTEATSVEKFSSRNESASLHEQEVKP